MNVKPNKINLDDRICTIINTIKSCDDWFNGLIDIDFDDSLERTKFFIGSEDKIGNLNDSNFKSLIKQIENFYLLSTMLSMRTSEMLLILRIQGMHYLFYSMGHLKIPIQGEVSKHT